MTNAQLTLSKTKDKVITTYKKVEEKLGLLFIVIVIIPTLCSIIYFGFWASDVYISESQFVIRTAQNPTNPAIGDYTIASSLTTSAVLQDSAAVSGYITSMDGLKEVNKDIDLVKLSTSHDIDIFNRFASFYWNESQERMFNYFNSRITVDVDPISFVTKLTVKSYTAPSAQKINDLLLSGSEQLVNKINERTRDDLVRFSQNSISNSTTKLEEITKMLNEARARGSNESDKNSISSIQVLYIERDTVERQLTVALDSYAQALRDAQYKSLYLEKTVKPNLPDYPQEPKRILDILATLMVCLIIYSITKIVAASVNEHQD